MRLQQEFEVAKPAPEVFAYLADVTNEAKWNPWARWVRKTSEGPIGLGSVFRGSYQGMGELDESISEYEPSRRVAYHSVPKGMHEAELTFELEAAGGSTRVRIVGTARPAGLMKLVEPMMAPRMKRHFRDLESGIKRELEGSATSG